jgi:lipid-binding SYLF domain-containing protein
MNSNTKTFKFNLLAMFAIIAISTGCSTMTTEEQDAKRKALDSMAEETIARLIEQDPAIQQELDESLGYFVADMKLTKVPIVGAGGGEGVLIDKSSDQPVYLTVGRFDVGGGWGVRVFKILLITKSQEVIDSIEGGTWEFQAGAEAAAGGASAEGSTSDIGAPFTTHILSEGGAAATVTARVLRISVTTELNE